MKNIKCVFMFLAAVFLLSGSVFARSRYFQFGNLNHLSVDITSTWTKLDTTATAHVFATKIKNGTLEVHVNSLFSIGELIDGYGVRFQVRVDDKIADFENQGAIQASNSEMFLSIFAVFNKIRPGKHTVSIWAQAAPTGSATDVVVDCGGWDGKIIIEEHE